MNISFLKRKSITIRKQQIISLSLPDKFIFENIGRSNLLDINGLSIQNIKKNILNLIK